VNVCKRIYYTNQSGLSSELHHDVECWHLLGEPIGVGIYVEPGGPLDEGGTITPYHNLLSFIERFSIYMAESAKQTDVTILVPRRD
jgi:hypothetical protein